MEWLSKAPRYTAVPLGTWFGGTSMRLSATYFIPFVVEIARYSRDHSDAGYTSMAFVLYGPILLITMFSYGLAKLLGNHHHGGDHKCTEMILWPLGTMSMSYTSATIATASASATNDVGQTNVSASTSTSTSLPTDKGFALATESETDIAADTKFQSKTLAIADTNADMDTAAMTTPTPTTAPRRTTQEMLLPIAYGSLAWLCQLIFWLFVLFVSAGLKYFEHSFYINDYDWVGTLARRAVALQAVLLLLNFMLPIHPMESSIILSSLLQRKYRKERTQEWIGRILIGVGLLMAIPFMVQPNGILDAMAKTDLSLPLYLGLLIWILLSVIHLAYCTFITTLEAHPLFPNEIGNEASNRGTDDFGHHRGRNHGRQEQIPQPDSTDDEEQDLEKGNASMEFDSILDADRRGGHLNSSSGLDGNRSRGDSINDGLHNSGKDDRGPYSGPGLRMGESSHASEMDDDAPLMLPSSSKNNKSGKFSHNGSAGVVSHKSIKKPSTPGRSTSWSPGFPKLLSSKSRRNSNAASKSEQELVDMSKGPPVSQSPPPAPAHSSTPKKLQKTPPKKKSKPARTASLPLHRRKKREPSYHMNQSLASDASYDSDQDSMGIGDGTEAFSCDFEDPNKVNGILKHHANDTSPQLKSAPSTSDDSAEDASYVVQRRKPARSNVKKADGASTSVVKPPSFSFDEDASIRVKNEKSKSSPGARLGRIPTVDDSQHSTQAYLDELYNRQSRSTPDSPLQFDPSRMKPAKYSPKSTPSSSSTSSPPSLSPPSPAQSKSSKSRRSTSASSKRTPSVPGTPSQKHGSATKQDWDPFQLTASTTSKRKVSRQRSPKATPKSPHRPQDDHSKERPQVPFPATPSSGKRQPSSSSSSRRKEKEAMSASAPVLDFKSPNRPAGKRSRSSSVGRSKRAPSSSSTPKPKKQPASATPKPRRKVRSSASATDAPQTAPVPSKRMVQLQSRWDSPSSPGKDLQIKPFGNRNHLPSPGLSRPQMNGNGTRSANKNESTCDGDYSFNPSSLDMLGTMPLRDGSDSYEHGKPRMQNMCDNQQSQTSFNSSFGSMSSSSRSGRRARIDLPNDWNESGRLSLSPSSQNSSSRVRRRKPHRAGRRSHRSRSTSRSKSGRSRSASSNDSLPLDAPISPSPMQQGSTSNRNFERTPSTSRGRKNIAAIGTPNGKAHRDSPPESSSSFHNSGMLSPMSPELVQRRQNRRISTRSLAGKTSSVERRSRGTRNGDSSSSLRKNPSVARQSDGTEDAQRSAGTRRMLSPSNRRSSSRKTRQHEQAATTAAEQT